ncbi:FAD/NAD(P)-binding domain-containing protein [Artomyces pyxidatus]|uniref:FAD/NAD(P)-binding domain-containing protein n=1 Tax=Artomyces pyxidatus TaxID=48021 RepID=A0ACB8SSX6_9AGAM|nr:FAD/NAD(P)-binding domain-containing protein [Artomyces pyxidatus]
MRVAVVGSGVSGLAATWHLNEYTEHEVHLYEADGRPGGHANTVTASQPGKTPVDVDTYIVFNPTTYPNFLRFLRLHPDIEILKTEMTFSVSRDAGAFEWAGDGLRAVFCQPLRVFDPGMWRMLYDVLRFNACARSLLAEEDFEGKELSIGAYLEREGYSAGFRDDYILPMTAAVWSTPPDLCALDFPAKTLIRFFHNHHLLQIIGKPSWLTIAGGSKKYVNAILSKLPSSYLRLNTPVRSVHSNQDGGKTSVILHTEAGETVVYDHVIFACHSDQALKIIEAGEGGATDDEKRILGRFGWSRNEVVLHSDESFMPRSRLAWSCWNYLTTSGTGPDGTERANSSQVSLPCSDYPLPRLIGSSDYMNGLQHISVAKHGLLLATLNPLSQPAPEKTLARFRYDHPILTGDAVRMQAEMPKIQNVRGLSFAGAWMRYGFHEDGFAAGLRAAATLGSSTSFQVENAERAGAETVGLVARAFGLFESSGARAAIGKVLSVWILTLFLLVDRVFAIQHRQKDKTA